MQICVFAGSSPGTNPAFLEAASALGKAIAERGFGIVYGGASIGLMGALANAALDAQGHVTGIIPEFLANREIVHPDLSQLHITPSMHARKQMMADMADGFIVLPGGFGTFDEMFEILTWAQLDLHRNPIALLNVENYFTPLESFLDNVKAQGFIKAQGRKLLKSYTDIDSLLDAIGSPD